jgi:hypothetical protein
MFNQYEPNVKATICFLKQLKVTVNNTTLNETLQNHPNWPGLLCIIDSSSKLNIPNSVGKIDADKINELPVPFAAYTYFICKPLFNGRHFMLNKTLNIRFKKPNNQPCIAVHLQGTQAQRTEPKLAKELQLPTHGKQFSIQTITQRLYNNVARHINLKENKSNRKNRGA